MVDDLIDRLAVAIRNAGFEWMRSEFARQGTDKRALSWADIPDEVFAKGALASLRPGDRIGDCVLAPTRLIKEAHAVMCETGWRDAIMHQRSDDGVIEAAASQIEAEFRAMIEAMKEG